MFATSDFAEHYTEVILNTLTKVGYYKPTNRRRGELGYCWWKGLPLSGVYERDLFLSEPNSLMVFEREMCMRLSKMIENTEEPIIEMLEQNEDGYEIWSQEVCREWQTMREKIYEIGVVWSETEKDLFFSQLKVSLEKKVLQIDRR